jgi:hypothetical protein
MDWHSLQFTMARSEISQSVVSSKDVPIPLRPRIFHVSQSQQLSAKQLSVTTYYLKLKLHCDQQSVDYFVWCRTPFGIYIYIYIVASRYADYTIQTSTFKTTSEKKFKLICRWVTSNFTWGGGDICSNTYMSIYTMKERDCTQFIIIYKAVYDVYTFVHSEYWEYDVNLKCVSSISTILQGIRVKIKTEKESMWEEGISNGIVCPWRRWPKNYFIFLLFVSNDWLPLWSSGQGSWLQIQRFG